MAGMLALITGLMLMAIAVAIAGAMLNLIIHLIARGAAPSAAATDQFGASRLSARGEQDEWFDRMAA